MVSPPELPVINLSDIASLDRNSASWTLKCQQVRDALEEHGCFIVVYDQVILQLRETVLDVLKELFELPVEKKVKKITKKAHHDRLEKDYVNSYYESMRIQSATRPENVKTFSDLMWPSGNDRFCEAMGSYTEQIAELDRLIVKMVSYSYGEEDFYESSYKDLTDYLLRFIKYAGPSVTTPHADKNFLTILSQKENKGLELLTKDGEKWINYVPYPTSFIVMAGTGAKTWSRDKIHAVVHRGTSPDAISVRFSVGLFSTNVGVTGMTQDMID